MSQDKCRGNLRGHLLLVCPLRCSTRTQGPPSLLYVITKWTVFLPASCMAFSKRGQLTTSATAASQTKSNENELGYVITLTLCSNVEEVFVTVHLTIDKAAVQGAFLTRTIDRRSIGTPNMCVKSTLVSSHAPRLFMATRRRLIV